MANTSSIFYQIGSKVRGALNGLLNPYTEVADIQNSTTLGTVAEYTYTSVGSTSTVRIIGTAPASQYVDVAITATQAASAPPVVTYVPATGNLVLDFASDATVADLFSIIKNDATLNVNFNAVLTGPGTELISAAPVSPATAFLAGKEVKARSNLTVEGNLTVNGTTTTVDTANLTVEDNVINLSRGASAGSYTKDSGLFFERASGVNPAFFVFDHSQTKFVLGGETTSGSDSDTFDAVASDAGRGTLQVGKIEVYDDTAGNPGFIEIGDLEDFSAGLS